MHILFWNQYYLPHLGGVEIFTARLADGLMARGHRVSVITSLYSDQLPITERIDGVDVYRFDFFRSLIGQEEPVTKLRLITHITNAVAAAKQSINPDIVHINLADPSPYFHLRTLHAKNCPTVITFQAAVQHDAAHPKSLVSSLIAQASRLAAVSNFSANNVAHFTGLSPEKLTVIFPGVPAKAFSAAQVDGVASGRTIAFLGRLVPEKGAALAIEALHLISADVRLNIIGDGVERPRLEALVQARGLTGRVNFFGEVDDATRANLLAQCDMLVVPSQHEELFGMVAVEGALSGLPVVATAIGGLPEIVEHGHTGFLVPKGDIAALANHLAVLTDDPLLSARLGSNGRQKALTLFGVERTCDLYESLYKTSLADHASIWQI